MLLMRRSYRILPVYTGDVSGVCSALYELGGLTVMHDPSGCNSTYNTHDEIRWYDKDSLIYISGLSERDAMLGNDSKFVDDIVNEAGELHPKFIALASSPVAFMTGTDFTALAKIIEEKVHVPAFFVPTNGMHDYVSGAGSALKCVADRLVIPAVQEEGALLDEPSDRRERKVNLLGVTPLDFGPQYRADEICRNLEVCGWQVSTVWAMGQTLEDLTRSCEAEVNLVVSSVGLPAARLLWEELHMPYVVGTPLGSFAGTVCESLTGVTEQEPGGMPVAYFRDRLDTPAAITVIGEPVTAGSMAALIEKEVGVPARVLCPLEEWEGLLTPNDRAVRGEEELMEELTGTKILVADPLYRLVCPEDCQFVEMPHIAFSGRIYGEKLPDLNQITEEIRRLLWE